MLEIGDLQGVKAELKRIELVFERKKAALYALCQYYAALALQELQQQQGFGLGSGGIWTNRTSEAIRRAFAKAIKERNAIGWFLAHGIDYGIYLELANDRKYAAIWPIVQRLADDFIIEAQRIYGG